LPTLGEKKNGGGQFFTPREIIRVIVNTVKPQVGKTVYDPCCGTGGFLIEAYKSMMKQNLIGTQIKDLKTETLWGREDAGEAIPICLANMMLPHPRSPCWLKYSVRRRVHRDVFCVARKMFMG